MKNKKIIITSTIIIILLITIVIVLNINSIFKQNPIDYSNYSFTNIRWTRETESDIEYIIFNSDGSFSYYCACGSPVNNSDLCDKYTYDDKTNTIKLKCILKVPSTVNKIKIKNYNDNSIELYFDDEIRIFIKE